MRSPPLSGLEIFTILCNKGEKCIQMTYMSIFNYFFIQRTKHYKVVFLTFQKYSGMTVTYSNLKGIPNVWTKSAQTDYVTQIKLHFYKSHVYNWDTPILLQHQ